VVNTRDPGDELIDQPGAPGHHRRMAVAREPLPDHRHVLNLLLGRGDGEVQRVVE